MDASDLEARRVALRLPLRDLAALSGLHEANIGKVLRGLLDSRGSTLNAIDKALTAEEERLAAYLEALIKRRSAFSAPDIAHAGAAA